MAAKFLNKHAFPGFYINKASNYPETYVEVTQVTGRCGFPEQRKLQTSFFGLII